MDTNCTYAISIAFLYVHDFLIQKGKLCKCDRRLEKIPFKKKCFLLKEKGAEFSRYFTEHF